MSDTMHIKSFMRRRLAKNEVAHSFKSAFWLRMHAFILVTWCGIIGYGTTKLLHVAGLDSMGIRYAIAVGASYLAFLVGVRIWLSYVGFGEYMESDDDIIREAADTATDIDFINSTNKAHVGYSGKGGTFDGGGASGDWSSGSGGSSSVSSDVSVDVDAEALPLIAIFVLLAALFIVLTGGVYLGVELLAELAFQMLLVIHIRRGIKKGGLPWLSAAFKNTWWAFLLVMAITVSVGTYAEHTYNTHTAMDTVRAIIKKHEVVK